jgi:hypothetical protein
MSTMSLFLNSALSQTVIHFFFLGKTTIARIYSRQYIYVMLTNLRMFPLGYLYMQWRLTLLCCWVIQASSGM